MEVQEGRVGQRHGRERGAGQSRAAGEERAGPGQHRAGAAERGARRRRPVPVQPRRGHARRRHAQGQGRVRRALALPRHLRGGRGALRRHTLLREEEDQARARRLRHRQPRPEEVVGARALRATPLPPRCVRTQNYNHILYSPFNSIISQ